jgi:methyl-accepting chemotaxis protein
MKRNIEKLEELSTNADLSEQINIELFDDFGYMTSVTNNLISSMGKMIAALKSETDQVEESAQVLSDVATTSASANNLMSETFERINNETLRQNELILSVSNDVSSLTESANHLKEYMLSESSAMQQNSASIAEMTANINSMANMTKKADAMFDELTQTSEEGNKLVAQAVTSISEIQKASKEVQSIVKTIQEIASQTNLLSMNAAIEAAHAGEFGTGFAVVADEVRSLATSSATSAKEIQAHIKDIVSKINVGVEAISSAGSAFKNIDQGVSENRELIKSLALAMEEQRIGAEETMKVTVEVTDALEKANELVHEQNEYAANVRTAMDNVVASSAEVSRVIKDGNAATDNINDAVQMIAQTSEQNNDVVRSMKEQINIYKV